MSTNNSIRVLLVDDDITLTDMYATYLEQNEIDVTMVHTAADALEITRSGKFDVIICDYQLPDIYGTSLVQLLVRRMYPHKCAIILLTGYEVRKANMLIVPSMILQKPLLPSELLRIIQELASSSKST